MTAAMTHDIPNARNTDPWTSHEAGAADRATLRERCYEALVAAWPEGLTDFELADRVGSQQTSAGKRRLELVREGRARCADTHRPAPSGKSALVWVACVG